jgi:acetyl esterase
MSRHRIADLQLRGSTSPLPVHVYWPGQAASQPVPLLVFCMAGDGAGPPAQATCRRLSQDAGLLVLAVSCPAGALDGTTVLEWAAELGADPGRLFVAGLGEGGAVAAAVASQARAARWPAVMLATGESGADLCETVRRSPPGGQSLPHGS